MDEEGNEMMIHKLLGGGADRELREEAYEVLRKMLVASRFPPLVHAVCAWWHSECDCKGWRAEFRSGSLAQEIGSGQEEEQSALCRHKDDRRLFVAYGLVKKKEYRRLRSIVGYR